MWSSYDCYLTAARDVLGLKLAPHSKYSAWEQAAIHGGFRVLHEKFCMVSDFPLYIKKDEQNRPHCENGPSHEWRDGWKLYHWHGVRVPPRWIENKESITPKEALSEPNMELRRAACSIVGWEKIISQLDARSIDCDPDPQIGHLIEVDLPGEENQKITARYVRVQCGTGRMFAFGVPPTIKTAIEAQAWKEEIPLKEWTKPQIRT